MQILQPIHAFLQLALEVFPLSRDLQKTKNFLEIGCSSSKCFGQALTHIPHPVHFSLSITGIPSFPISIASKLQAKTQSP